jgi:hypothetical protein
MGEAAGTIADWEALHGGSKQSNLMHRIAPFVDYPKYLRLQPLSPSPIVTLIKRRSLKQLPPNTWFIPDRGDRNAL